MFLVHLIRRPLAFDKCILALCLLLPRIKLAPIATDLFWTFSQISVARFAHLWSFLYMLGYVSPSIYTANIYTYT